MGAMITEDKFCVLSLSLTIASVAANTSAEQTFTVKGVKPGDFMEVSKPSLHAGLGVGNVRVSAKDQIAIQFTNSTGSPIVPGAETWTLFVVRPEQVRTSVVL